MAYMDLQLNDIAKEATYATIQSEYEEIGKANVTYA